MSDDFSDKIYNTYLATSYLDRDGRFPAITATDPTLMASYSALQSYMPSSFASFFNSHLTGQNLPYTFDSLMNEAETFSSSTASKADVLTAFADEFYKMTGQLNLETAGYITTPTDEEKKAQFKAAFEDFLATYPVPSTGPITASLFFKNWVAFLSYNSILSSTTPVNTNTLAFLTGGQITPLNVLTSYRKQYDTFVTGGTDATFKTAVQDYYKAVVGSQGYFSLGRAFDGWMQHVVLEFKNNVVYSTLSVTTDQSKRTMKIDEVLVLIASMIGNLQWLAVAQSEQITFLTKWQRVYTDLISQVRIFKLNDRTMYGLDGDVGAGTTETEKRTDANTTAGNYRETLTAYRQTVADTAKREQTHLNQTQDAQQQQASMATSLIQQLSTILGAIYR